VGVFLKEMAGGTRGRGGGRGRKSTSKLGGGVWLGGGGSCVTGIVWLI